MRRDTIGSRIKRVRQCLSTSPSDFAATSGIPTSTLQKYESDTRTPGGDALAALYRLNINVNWLLSGDGAMMIDNDYVAEFNRELMSDVVEAVDIALTNGDRVLTPSKKAKLIIAVYELYTESGSQPDKAQIMNLVVSTA